MNLTCFVFAALISASNGVSGYITNSEGTPIAQARVFMEPGIAGSLIEVDADVEGRFNFPEVPIGPVGFFAHAPGFAFGGQHLNLSVGETPDNLRILLRKPDAITGSIKNSNGDKLEGARITRLALLDDKVGIPLAKLKAFGFEEPASNKNGNFILSNLPMGTSVALKVGHADYAQEGVESVVVGSKVDVTLYRGALIDGTVIQTSGQQAVSQAAVLIRNAQPPYDTALAQTDAFGVFTLRLKPGVYLAQALSVGQSSPGWQELVVTGEHNIVKCRLNLVGTGVITGKLLDAVSGNPVEGARITLVTNGNMAAVERTGPTGEFHFVAGQGRNVVAYAATPGYLSPETREVSLDLTDGATISLPDMWLAPVPPFFLEVVDEDMNPVPNARVQLLRPRQFGWQTAGTNGQLKLQLGNLASDGKVVGLAEDPAHNQAALFQLEQGNTKSARVQVLPLGTLKGKVIGERSKPLSGATVGAIFPGEDVNNSLLLWRVLSDTNGNFFWPSLAPGFPQICIARTNSGLSSATRLVQGKLDAATIDLGELRIEGGKPEISVTGTSLDWGSGGILCGTPLTETKLQQPKVLFYISSAQLGYVLETLQKEQQAFAARGWALAILVEGSPNCNADEVPIYKGKAPSKAETFILDANDRVLMETFDVPSFILLDALINP